METLAMVSFCQTTELTCAFPAFAKPNETKESPLSIFSALWDLIFNVSKESNFIFLIICNKLGFRKAQRPPFTILGICYFSK